MSTKCTILKPASLSGSLVGHFSHVTLQTHAEIRQLTLDELIRAQAFLDTDIRNAVWRISVMAMSELLFAYRRLKVFKELTYDRTRQASGAKEVEGTEVERATWPLRSLMEGTAQTYSGP